MNAEPVLMIQMPVAELERMIREAVNAALDEKFEPLRKQFEDRLIGVDEVCQKLNVTRMTIYNIEKRGELHPVRIGKKVQYRESDIMSYINRKNNY